MKAIRIKANADARPLPHLQSTVVMSFFGHGVALGARMQVHKLCTARTWHLRRRILGAALWCARVERVKQFSVDDIGHNERARRVSRA